MKIKIKNSLKVIFGLFVILLVAGCVLQQDKKTVNTNGQATLEVQPDQAVVYVSIETLAESAEESKNENNQITEDVYAALYLIGVERDKIETQNFNIYEEYDWTGEGRESLGFKTSHTLKITTEEFDDVGEIVDAAVGAGATRISSIRFELSEERESQYKKEALAAASKDAREKAEAIASGLEAELGELVSITDSSYSYRPYPLYEATAMAGERALEEAVTQISPQELEVTASVQVTYEIE